MKVEFSEHILKNPRNIKVHENPSTGSQVVPCGQTDRTKLIVAVCNSANTPKNVI
jgi:hypothetical protein